MTLFFPPAGVFLVACVWTVSLGIIAGIHQRNIQPSFQQSRDAVRNGEIGCQYNVISAATSARKGAQLHSVHCTIFLRSPASRQSRESTGCATDSRTGCLPIRGNTVGHQEVEKDECWSLERVLMMTRNRQQDAMVAPKQSKVSLDTRTCGSRVWDS